MNIRRICLYGGPGCGKSSLSGKIYSELKAKHYDVELIREWIKEWAYLGREPVSYDQVFVFANQIHNEDVALRCVKSVVTDCPLLMCYAYSKFYKSSGADQILQIVKEFDAEFPALNLYIERTVPYVDKGRYQDLDQAKEFDNCMKNILDDNVKWYSVTVNDFDEIMSKIEEVL